jgi:sRNA-binding carbon storage regulator CsrA
MDGFLCLTRKPGERIVIGPAGPHQVELVVIGLGPGRVRLGFRCGDRDYPIHRREVYDRLVMEAYAAKGSTP